MGLKKDIAKLITDVSAVINKPMIEGFDFYMVYQPKNHNPLPKPDGKIAVYTFYYNDLFLKIGQAGIKSPARYNGHPYNQGSGPSTLAGSPSMSSLLDEDTVNQWIKDNCERFDVIIDGTKYDKHTLNFIEGLLHYKYKPKC